MGKPAARVGDMHDCPMVTPGTGTPHMGGAITGPGCGTVLIGGKPAATVGDNCSCVEGQDTITGGSSGVFIGGKPAARMGDPCAHGGTVRSGCGSVLIGERRGVTEKERWKEPSDEEKVKTVNEAIITAIGLLVKKLELLEMNDTNIMDEFKRWFGRNDDEAKQIIVERIRRVLAVIKILTVENFIDKPKNEKEENLYAEVYNSDKHYRIFVGELFWKIASIGGNSNAGIIIHELSHFKDIGDTKDFVYKDLCLRLAETDPKDAMCNADNFELFVVG